MLECELRDPDHAENLSCTRAEVPDDDVREIPPDAARKERTYCQHSIGIVAQKRRARKFRARYKFRFRSGYSLAFSCLANFTLVLSSCFCTRATSLVSTSAGK